MVIFDRYLFRNLFVAMLFVALALAAVIFLTQSLRFLELVIDSGASSLSFWILTILALPRFFEIILPIALMMAIAFVYNRMTMDSEIVVMRSIGSSQMALARPAITLSIVVTVLLWGLTTWVAPVSLSHMHHMRQVIKAQYSSLLFREGVFNPVGSELTVYVRKRTEDGDLHGLMIHDNRKELEFPVTVMAKRGVLVEAPEGGQQVLVYDGTRQEFDEKKKVLNRLDFERYVLDLPESGTVRQRWREPDERTLFELLDPDLTNARDRENRREFVVEAHKRVVGPLLAPAFALITLVSLLLGPVDRRGQGFRIMIAAGLVIVIQGLFLAAYNLSRQTEWALVLMYALVVLPSGTGLFLLSRSGEKTRRQLLFKEGTAS